MLPINLLIFSTHSLIFFRRTHQQTIDAIHLKVPIYIADIRISKSSDVLRYSLRDSCLIGYVFWSIAVGSSTVVPLTIPMEKITCCDHPHTDEIDSSLIFRVQETN